MTQPGPPSDEAGLAEPSSVTWLNLSNVADIEAVVSHAVGQPPTETSFLNLVETLEKLFDAQDLPSNLTHFLHSGEIRADAEVSDEVVARLERLWIMYGRQLSDLSSLLIAGPDGWNRLKLEAYAELSYSGNERVQLRLVIEKNDRTIVRLEIDPDDYPEFLASLINAFVKLSPAALIDVDFRDFVGLDRAWEALTKRRQELEEVEGFQPESGEASEGT